MLNAATAVVLGMASVLSDRPLYRSLDGVVLGVQLLLAVSLLVRRRMPWLPVWIAASAAAAIALAEAADAGAVVPPTHAHGDRIWIPVAAWLAVYAGMAYGGRVSWAGVGLLGVLAARPWGDDPTGFFAQSLLLVVCPALLGLYVAARARAVRSLTDRAERAERERHLLAERARAEERTRLAAEMHDVVAHRISLLVLQAGALRVRSPDASARAAAEEIRATGCQALEELRDVIGLLRRVEDGDDDTAPMPVTHAPVPDLAALVAESASVGVPVELLEEGASRTADPVLGRAAHRVVQEALTNVRKHAPGAAATVRLAYRPDGLTVSVVNGPATRPPDRALVAAGSGAGLTGLRERVALLGGRLTAGPGEGGGFHVTAELPAAAGARA